MALNSYAAFVFFYTGIFAKANQVTYFMAGLYIHIPFCRQACHYCDFHFSINLDTKSKLVDALIREMELHKNYLGEEKIETIYFGGGTPSLLEENELEAIFDQIYKQFNISKTAEITIEANPDDLTPAKITTLLKLSVNRLSIGIQSFFDKDLQWMNRAHNSSQALQAVSAAQEAGFNNISIDLIYGLPEGTAMAWDENIDKALSLGVQHISCYCLTVEPRTALAHFIATKKIKPADEETAAIQFEKLMQRMLESGWHQYEISNFACDEKHISRHNAAYWQGEKYLGTGPAAHSYNGTTRQWNVSNNQQYIRSIASGVVPFEMELLTATQRINEKIMTQLRTSWGLNLTQFESSVTEKIIKSSTPFIKDEYVKLQHHVLMLTQRGKLIADRIILELMLEEGA